MYVLVSAISYSATPELTKRRIEQNNAITRSLPRGCANCFRTREAAEAHGKTLPFETMVLEATSLSQSHKPGAVSGALSWDLDKVLIQVDGVYKLRPR